MNDLQGFSLIEVLVSLFLSTSIALMLIQQQWKLNKFFNQLLQQNHSHQMWKNTRESKYSLSKKVHHSEYSEESSEVIAHFGAIA